MKVYPVLFLLFSGLAWGQHNNRSARDLQFRFSNPGARSLGFGGAFIGLADDATSPVANPAGMSRIAKRSASLELNYNRTENDIPYAAGAIQQTNLFEFDYNFQGSSAPESMFQVPYLAAVFPSGRWRFAVFTHQQANLKRNYDTSLIPICNIGSNFYPDCGTNAQTNFGPGTDTLRMEILNLGGSIGVALSEKFSIGLSLFTSELDYQADSVSDVIRSTRTVRVQKLAYGKDRDLGGIAGLLWKATEELSLGLTYKFQPEFTYTAELTKDGPLTNTPDDFVTEALFKVPDAISFGLSINPVDQATLNLDANRVFYSEITDELLDYTLGMTVTTAGTIVQTMPDVTEIHVGFEWIFANLATPLSFRLGYWHDPYHAATNNVDDSQILVGDADDPNVRDIFFLHLFEQDQDHYSLGLGWTFGQKLQMDLAFESSDSNRNGTVSGIYRF